MEKQLHGWNACLPSETTHGWNACLPSETTHGWNACLPSETTHGCHENVCKNACKQYIYIYIYDVVGGRRGVPIFSLIPRRTLEISVGFPSLSICPNVNIRALVRMGILCDHVFVCISGFGLCFERCALTESACGSPHDTHTQSGLRQT
jgi:hypothetical protein